MRSNKKILHYVAPSDLSLGRANSVHVMKMCNAINNKQSIKLFALSSRDMKNLHEFYNSSSNFQIKTFNFLFKRFHGFYVSIAHLLHCFYKREIPDFIITRSPYTAIFWSHHKKLNILYEAHNNLTNLQARFFKIFCKRNKVKLIVISESLGKSFRDFIEQKIFNENILLRDASDLPSEKYKKKRFDKKKINIGYVGHLYPGKGFEIILEIARNINNDHFQFHVIGPYTKEQLNEAPENLTLYGYIPQKEIEEYLSIFDFALAPYQNFCNAGGKYNISNYMSPLKIFEYMAHKVPVISSDLPVIREFLENEINALMVDPTNISDWINAILRLANDRPLSKKISSRAFTELKKKYTWDKRAEEILKFV